MQAAKDRGYDVTLRYVAVDDAEKNIRRVEARTALGGHWIAPDTVRRRAMTSLENLPAAIAIADRSVLLDNSDATYRQVLDVERGRVLSEAPDPPRWLAGQIPRIAAELERVARESRPTPSLSADARLVQAALNEQVERGRLDAAGQAKLKADIERQLVDKEEREGPITLSKELRRLAMGSEAKQEPEPDGSEPNPPKRKRRR